jgi:hypothetical protein
MIWSPDDYITLPPDPPRDVRIMLIIAAIFGVLLILAATIAPAFLQEAA